MKSQPVPRVLQTCAEGLIAALTCFGLVTLFAVGATAQSEASAAEPASDPATGPAADRAAEPAADRPVESGTLTTRDGVPVVYEIRGTGDPTLVFVHCWACDRQVWREQVDVFAEDHRIVTLDLPGHGESGAGRDSWTLDGLAHDVVQLVESLDLDDFVLVGHSMGGPVSLLAATHLQDRVQGIVCVDTLHDLEMKPPPEQAKAWNEMFENDFEGSVARMTAVTMPGESKAELRDWVVERALKADREAALGLMKDFASLELSAEAQEAGVPIRCINAAMMQQQMPADAAERNREFADYEVTVMEDVGHFLLLEAPEPFNELLRQAIASIEAASGD